MPGPGGPRFVDSTFGGMVRWDALAVFFMIVTLSAALLTVLLSDTYMPLRRMPMGEYYTVMALGTLGITYDDHTLLYRGKGCATCSRTGYRGRAGIHELLVATDSMKRLIQGRAPVLELLAAARAEGLTTLVQDGIVKSLDGVTDYKQVKAVAIK